jgi:ubiquinone/menaquinone biosynthesis C-methylase UbiE
MDVNTLSPAATAAAAPLSRDAFWAAVDEAHDLFLRGALDPPGLFSRLEEIHARAPRVEGPSSAFPLGEADRRLARGYDSLMYWPALQEYFGHSDYVNFGFWEDATPDAAAASENLVARLADAIPVRSRDVLDVACGKGATTRYLARRFPEASITGINISEKQLETCRTNAPGSRFLRMDATALEFAGGSFDAILCVEAAFHFRTRERFLKEAYRVLRPGGVLSLCDLLLTRAAEARRPGRHVENYLEDPEAYARLARGVGFEVASMVDANRASFEGAFRHLARFSHEQFLAGALTSDGVRTLCGQIFETVPDFRHYLLASFKKPA